MELKIRKKVLFLSSGDTFGAYEFIYRMAKFMENDYEIAMVVRDKRKPDLWLLKLQVVSPKKKFYKRVLNFVKRKFGIKIESLSTDPRYVFLPGEDEHVQLIPADAILRLIPFVPEVVISGMTDGFLNTTTLLALHKETGAQVYQVMVDMNFITGGCHFIRECEGFKNDCSKCPAIINKKFIDFTANNFAIKKQNIQQGNFKLMVVPGWTLYQANLSILYNNRVKIIASSVIDTDLFTNINRDIARQIFGMPINSKVIFAGSNNASSELKGREYLVEALLDLWKYTNENLHERVVIFLVGNHNKEDDLTKLIPFKKLLIDYISDYRLLSLAYQASDIFVCPSLEDAGPMMVAEALSCGTPVVGFDTGLLFDDTLVQNGLNGFRVKMKDSQELAVALQKIIKLNDFDFQKMSESARKQAEKYTSKQAFLKSIKDI